jgi:photosystem II stability/assembly factor-like uncharacterized protein
VVLGLAACLTVALIPAQAIPAGTDSALHWRLIGPHRGGRVLAVAGIAGDPATFYFGAVDGGVWRTNNAGVTWDPLFDGQPIASIGAMAVAASDPRIIYVGTGEASIRSDITYGAGVYKSTDAGATWRLLGLQDTRHIGKLLIDPTNPDVVLVAALGHAYGPNAERGVFRSTDGGRTWTKVLYKDPDTGAIDLAADPGDARVVYAALWQARRTPWEQYQPDEGPGSGLYKSGDGGATWTPITGRGLPDGPYGRIGLAVARGGRVYALIGASAGRGGLFRSDDGGATWQLAGADPRLTSRNWYFCRVTVDPQNPDLVYVPNVSLLKSVDGGKTFTVLKGQPGGDDYHELWIDHKTPTHMIVGSDQGAVITLDGGRTWSSWYNQPTAQFYHVAVDDRFPYRVYGAQQDAGTASITSRSDYGEITFRDWAPVGGGESGYITPDPLDPDIVYGGDTYGVVHRFDRVTGQFQDITPWPAPTFGQPMPLRRYRFTWTSPIVFDRKDPRVLYIGAQMVLATRDGGLHWEAASPDLTGAAASTHDTGPVSVANAAGRGYGVVYTIAPSPLAAGMIWVGSDDGLIHRTTDGGRHWENITPEGLPPWSMISLIEASPFDTAAAYAAVDRHRLDDFAPYFYRTRDGGRHWTRITQGVAPLAYAQAIRADPARQGLLYAGTETGVYVSFDDGDHWQSLQLNLPTVSVRDLAVHEGDLVAATHGRSFWILDDLAPLRQLSDSVVRAGVHLFAPERAIRVRRSVSNDTPLPPEEPHGENPPAGAIIDYFLQSGPLGAVTLDILDAGGRVVRRFSSEDRPLPLGGGEPLQVAAEWLPRPEPLSRRAGLNRFVWDLRYPPPPIERYGYSIAAIAGHGTTAQPQGPLVLPGEYQLRLTAAGRTLTRILRVDNDPRVHASDSALVGQLRLTLEIWNAMAAQYALRGAVRGVRDQLGAAAMPALDSIVQSAAAGDLAGLETVVESGDREPPQQAREVFEGARVRLAQAQRRWQEFVTKDLVGLNARRARQHLPPVTAPAIKADAVAIP